MASDAEQPTTDENGGADTGTDPETRTVDQTQSITTGTVSGGDLDLFYDQGPIPAPAAIGTSGEDLAAFYDLGPAPPKENVAASQPDDTGSSAVAAQLGADYAQFKVTPQSNVLDQFVSYTYNASVYLMTPDQYNALLVSKKKKINGYQLLFQSGGADNKTGNGVTKVNADGTPAQSINAQGRNPYFTDDFYIDSVTINNDLPGKVTGAAHMVTDLKFTVVEPANISLLDRLYAAVQDFVPKNGQGAINYTAVTYLMVIRFYGYDQNGKLIGGSSGSDTGNTDNNAIVEKFIPFMINGIDWSVGSKLVTYDFKCSPTGQIVAGTTRRGTIPYDIELSATSLKELLGGKTKYSTASAAPAAPGSNTNAPVSAAQSERDDAAAVDAAAANGKAPEKANTAAKKNSITGGLMDAMNEFQQQLVKEGIYQYADEYYLKFADAAIENATIVLPGADKNKAATPMAKPATQDPNALVKQQQAKLNARNFTITAGQQILQAIELAIRNSSYITNQSLTIYNEETGEQEPNPSARNKPMQWFQITMEAVQKPKEYDRKRNDFAYIITFTISRYIVPNFDSRYFPATNFPGVHKVYNFWFTGQNTAVLDYTANFNSLYNITVTGNDPKNSAAAQIKRSFTSSMRDMPKLNYQAASTESRIGAKNTGNEIGANAAEYLYDPSSLGEVKMRIVGDPAWIQQGSLFAGVNPKAFNYQPFLPDGTINFDSSQVLFEVAWQRPEDYNLATGIADPYSRTVKSTGDRKPLQSYIYQATRCISEFRQGRFEQTLEGSLYMFPIPSGTNTATTAAKNAAQSDAGRPNPNTTNTTVDSQTAADQSSSSPGPRAEPEPSETPPSNSPNNNDTEPGQAASPADPAEPTTSNGEDVAWYDYEPPLKMGQDYNVSSEPTQSIAEDA